MLGGAIDRLPRRRHHPPVRSRMRAQQDRLRHLEILTRRPQPPYLTKNEIMRTARERGLEPPRLNLEGFPHNNCGGFCIKAGHAQFRLLLKRFTERYAFHEQKERELREYLGKEVSILRDRGNGESRTLTLEAFRLRVEAGQRTDEFDWGGCGCAIDDT